MSNYSAPLRDMHFVIDEVLEAPLAWREMPAFAHVDGDTARQVLEEGAKFAAGVLAPINAAGDLEGCTLGRRNGAHAAGLSRGLRARSWKAAGPRCRAARRTAARGCRCCSMPPSAR